MSGALCIGLRFRFGFSAEQWTRTLRSLVEWEPRLEPTHVHRRNDPTASPREPWSDARWPELARRLAQERSWSWGLERLRGESTSLDVGAGLHQNDALIAVDRPEDDLVERLVALVEALRGGAEPALAFVYACDGADAELALQGLQRMDRVPPVLYLDAAALERVGGRARLRDAPCRVVELPHGGAVLATRDPADPPGEADRRVASFLRLPVAFLDEPG